MSGKPYQSQIDDKAAKQNERSLNAEIIHRLSTWRDPRTGTLSTSSIGFDVDTTEITEALDLVKQLAESAKEAFAACEKLGIKIGGQP